jgi:hypothetical protein
MEYLTLYMVYCIYHDVHGIQWDAEYFVLHCWLLQMAHAIRHIEYLTPTYEYWVLLVDDSSC